jgi:hypothetical protein
LPEFNHSISGEVGANRDRLIDFLSQQNIVLEYNEKITPALGVSYGGRIALLPGQSPAQEFTTLVHEVAHELLHRSDRRMSTSKTVRETEAEAVAFVVGNALGLELGTAASDYIQLYDGNASLIAESLEFIQRTSSMSWQQFGGSLRREIPQLSDPSCKAAFRPGTSSELVPSRSSDTPKKDPFLTGKSGNYVESKTTYPARVSPAMELDPQNLVGQTAGSRIVKAEPFPGSESRSISPPCASTDHLAIARPRPAPPCSRVRPPSSR